MAYPMNPQSKLWPELNSTVILVVPDVLEKRPLRTTPPPPPSNKGWQPIDRGGTGGTAWNAEGTKKIRVWIPNK